MQYRSHNHILEGSNQHSVLYCSYYEL